MARQFEQNVQLNQRAQQLLGFGGLILGVVLGLTRPAGETDVVVLVAVAIFLFVLLATTAGLGWSLRGLRRDPLPAPLWEHYRLAPAPWLRQLLVLNLIASYDDNVRVLAGKIRYIKVAQGCLAVEVLCLSVLVILLPYVS